LDGLSPRFTAAYLGGWRNRIEKKSNVGEPPLLKATRLDQFEWLLDQE
jgi:hypothetical protein